MKILFLVLITILFSGCSNKIIHPELTKEIEALLDIKTQTKECKYPKLPVFKVPLKQKVSKGTSLEKAFKRCVKTNKRLRLVCDKYRRVAIETNKRYQHEQMEK